MPSKFFGAAPLQPVDAPGLGARTALSAQYNSRQLADKAARVPIHTVLTIFFFAVALSGLWIPSLPAQGADRSPRIRPDRILIIPKREQTQALDRMHVAEGATVLRRFPALGNVEVLSLRQGADARAVIARYRQSRLVEAVESDHWFTIAATPDDPFYADGTQWNLNNVGQNGGVVDADIDAPEAWETYNSASNIIVAVIDTGARLTHEDLSANLWNNPGEIPGNGVDDDLNGFVDDVHGINTIAQSGDPSDDIGHGTHVAGILGAVGNNGKGIAGVCWGVRLMICKFLNNDGGSESDLIQCLDYARSMGARVINCSFVSPDFSTILSNAFWNLRSAGIVVVAAAGNGGTDNDLAPQYPASFKIDNLIAVTATTQTDGFAGYNYGANSVHLAAPGYQIYSTSIGYDAAYVYLSGTSMAAPHVSGAAALLLARFPSDDYRSIIARVINSVDPLSSLAGRCTTGGRLNLSKALGPPLQADFIPSKTSGLLPLTVNFTNTSFGAITNYLWDFGDGSSQNHDLNPTHTFTNAGTFTVTLTAINVNGSASVTNHTIHVAENYQIQAGVFDWVPTNGMTVLSFGANGISGPHPLPFTFRLFGQEYSEMFVGANGLIGFSSDGLDVGSNVDLPNNVAPNAAVYVYWDSLNPSAGGSIWIGSAGATPNRKVVVSWIDVPHAIMVGPPTRFTFQAILHESQHVAFQYLDVESGRNSLTSGKSATIGLEDASGTIASKYTFNGSPALVMNQQALLFVPYGSASVAPSLTRPQLGAGQFTCMAFAAPMQSCVFEGSSDLSSWIPVKTNVTPASGAMSFSDSNASNKPWGFYRARVQ
jgi:subtilisin family serine protease